MKGKIGFEQHVISCIIGCHEEERAQERLIHVDLKVEVNIEAAAKNDTIADAVDYHELSRLCERVAEKQFHLMETYADTVLSEIFALFPVTWGWIKVSKPKPFTDTRCTFVELERTR